MDSSSCRLTATAKRTVNIKKDWKDKYFDSLQKLEDEQQSWGELEALLRKVISRLAITSKGIDKRLDRVLSAIQKHSRQQKNEALQADLEELSSLVARIEDDDSSADRGSAEPAEHQVHQHLLDLIDRLRLDLSGRSQLETFKSRLHTLDDDRCIEEFAGLVNDLLQQGPVDQEAVREVLITLVEKIAFTHGESDHLNSIKRRLDDQFVGDNWQAYLDEIIAEVRVIIDGINDEKIELETLVVDVTRQLNEISGVLSDEHSDNLQGREEARNLQSLMDESVSRIQTSVATTTDIDQLKSRINENLVTIRSGIGDFIASDEERFRKFEQRNATLTRQIKQLEQESSNLKLRLSEDRKKLMFDTLTGARSRLSYEELLEQELYRWSRYREEFSFALLDIDHFKQINDRFGHSAGDKALQIVARLMSRNIRKTDFLFRIGGEEFVLLLPKTNLEGAEPLVEKLRRTVGSTGFHYKQRKVEISLSGGVTAITEGDTAESIYERADQALYQAKNGGRNRLVSRAA